MERKRIFVGISFAEETLAALSSIQEEWKKRFPSPALRWIPKENFHMTLHFLGGIEEWRVSLISQAFNEISLPKFSFSLNRMLAFPNERQARVLCVGGQQGNSPLSDLFWKTGQRLESVGHRLETRVFVPHVTLARIVAPFALQETLSISTLTFEATSFHLYESQGTSSGSHYEKLATFTL